MDVGRRVIFSHFIAHVIVLPCKSEKEKSQLLLPIIDYADIIYHNTSDTYHSPYNVVFKICRSVSLKSL